MLNRYSLFAQQDQQFEKVIIHPGGGRPSTITSSYPWTEYEQITVGIGGSGEETLYGTEVISQEQIAKFPSSWSSWGVVGSGSETFRLRISANQIDKASVGYDETVANTLTLGPVVGYRRRYVSMPVSKVIDVNGGAPMGVSQSIEIDIATELGQEYLEKDLDIKLFAFNDGSVGGRAGWGEVGDFIYLDGNGSAGSTYGIKAQLHGYPATKIIVSTGNAGLLTSSDSSGSSFGQMTNSVTSCAVKLAVSTKQLHIERQPGSVTGVYPQPWQDVPASWFASGVTLYSDEDVLRYRFVDPTSIHIAGIVRATIDNSKDILNLPYTSVFPTKIQYRSNVITSAQSTAPYLYLSKGGSVIKGNGLGTAAWIMMDTVFEVN